MRTPKLTDQMAQEIGQCLRLGLNWTQVAKVVGVHRSTLVRWRKEAETAESGTLQKLHDVVESAKAGVIHALSATVIEAATQETLTKRTEKETRDREGNPYTEITKTYEGPNISAAFKVLEKFYPELWGKVDDGTDGSNTTDGTDLTHKLTAAENFLTAVGAATESSTDTAPSGTDNGSTNATEASGESD